MSVIRERPAEAASKAPHTRTGTKAVAIAIAACIVVALAAFWAGTIVHGEAASIPQHIQEPRATAVVRKGVLTDRLNVQGTIQLPAGTAVKALTPQLEAGAVPLVTAVPIHRGSEVANGMVLAAIAGEPVIVLEGSTPMYRTLKLGSHGEDVAQLQRALTALGYPVSDPRGEYGLSTAAAAAAMFRARGYELPKQQVEERAASAKDASGASGASGGKSAAGQQRTVATVPAAAIVFVSRLPAQVVRVAAEVGREVGSTLATVSWGAPEVVASLEASQLQTLRPGMQVIWEGHRGISGVVASVGQPSSGEGTSSGGEGTSNSASGVVRVRFGGAHLPPVGERIELGIMRHTSGVPVLNVPFSAVRSGPSGESYVEVGDGRRFRKMLVTVGLSVGGYVAIVPRSGVLAPGAEVAVGE